MTEAWAIAEISKCHDKQVGCILLDKEGNRLAHGCNISCGHDSCLKKEGKICTAIHAEVSAINLVQKGEKPYTAICTLEPCLECAKKLYTAGIREIYFCEKTSRQKRGTAWFENQFATQVTQICYENETVFESVHERALNWAYLFKAIRQYHKDLGYPKEYTRTEPYIGALQKQQIRSMVLALVDEAHEALHEVDWKPWKNYNGQPKINVEKFLEETGDILFFIDGMLMTFGLSWDDLMQAVAQKLKVVRGRMATGYHN